MDPNSSKPVGKKIIVLGDFNVRADDVASFQAWDLVSSMMVLELSRFVSVP